MTDISDAVRAQAHAMGLELPEERLADIANAVEAVLKQAEEVRGAQTPMPTPSPFDASWSESR